MTQERPPRRGRYIAVFLLTLVLVSVAAYAVGVWFANSASVDRERRQQSLINSLVSQNSDLQRQLASAAHSGNTSLLGLIPVQIYADSSPSIVTVQGVQTSSSGNATILGSGFVTQFQGKEYVVTNYHVVHDVVDISVTFFDGNSFAGSVLGTDAYVDLAVLNLTAPSAELHPLTIAGSSGLRVGEPVVAIGNPFGLAGSMTFGIISQTGRTLTETAAGNFAIADVIQFSAPINPGNSGGPLLNANGSVVGITTAAVLSSQGVGFAIPSDVIERELPSLITTGSYTLHSYMGVIAADMNLQLSRLQGTNTTYGSLVQNVTAGGPSAIGGLRGGDHTVSVQGVSYSIGGDIIIGMNGSKIVNTDALSAYLQEFTLPGQTVMVQVIRNGSVMTVEIVLGTRPPPPVG
ncbi:MAG: trypsin-like peptidase domain-containing protein [Thaumarchaeota archaeon]|nr:trypsin-like peptidase domain-containing protein [Nitrososphaerota archaeon]